MIDISERELHPVIDLGHLASFKLSGNQVALALSRPDGSKIKAPA